MVESFALPASTDAPRQARQAVTTAVAHAVPRDVLGRIVLMTSEIVTNALIHGGADGKGIHMIIEVNRLRARVTVTDSGAPSAPSMQQPSPGQVGGYGLFLVDQLSDRWGVGRDAGTAVYFEIDLLARPSD